MSKFIEDFIDLYLKDNTNIELHNITNSIELLKSFTKIQTKEDFSNLFDWFAEPEKILFFQKLLSRNPDGKAVMPFLDVETQEKVLSTETLDHLLYREFTEALRVGKSFDEALEIIDEIYKYYATK